MVGRAAHVFDVTRPQTFLTAGGASKLQFDLTQKVILEWIHSGRCKQDRVVPFGNENVARTNTVVFGFKEFEILIAYFVSFHFGTTSKEFA